VRVLIDRQGGVDLDAITTASRAISPVLDAADPFAGPYLLEVSSPGIERPLRRPEHFRGARGEVVAITHHTDTGPRRTRGVLVDADDGGCVVEVEGTSEPIAYDAITKARTVYDWGAASRPAAPVGRKQRAKESHA
jgi:ribosome maturation factor RimP